MSMQSWTVVYDNGTINIATPSVYSKNGVGRVWLHTRFVCCPSSYEKKTTNPATTARVVGYAARSAWSLIIPDAYSTHRDSLNGI